MRAADLRQFELRESVRTLGGERRASQRREDLEDLLRLTKKIVEAVKI